MNRFAGEYAESVHNILGEGTLITDTDQVVAVSGVSKKEYMEKKLSPEIEEIIQDKKTRIVKENENPYPITGDDEGRTSYFSQIIVPIVSQGDAIGSVIVFSKEKGRLLGDIELRTAEVGANFLARQMES